MDESIIKELAEAEVDLQRYEWRPKWKSLFHYSMPDKITDLSRAIKFYKDLTEEQIERRYCIHYWENAAWGYYDLLRHTSQEVFRRSISPSDLAKREIINIELLLNEGKYQLFFELDSSLCINDIPALYEQLLTGQWVDFLTAKEICNYEDAYEASEQEFLYNCKKMFDRNEKLSNDSPVSKGFMDEFMQYKKEFENKTLGYINYFNKLWVVSMQIQALVWYKEFLKKVEGDGIFNFGGGVLDWVAPKEKKQQTIMSMDLIRNNDGYSAMILSFNNFKSEKKCNPTWQELMDYMVKSPPEGIEIKPAYKGNKVSELSIEGINNPVDREAFRKRYVRYFKKILDEEHSTTCNDSNDIVHTKVYF